MPRRFILSYRVLRLMPRARAASLRLRLVRSRAFQDEAALLGQQLLRQTERRVGGRVGGTADGDRWVLGVDAAAAAVGQ